MHISRLSVYTVAINAKQKNNTQQQRKNKKQQIINKQTAKTKQISQNTCDKTAVKIILALNTRSKPFLNTIPTKRQGRSPDK